VIVGDHGPMLTFDVPANPCATFGDRYEAVCVCAASRHGSLPRTALLSSGNGSSPAGPSSGVPNVEEDLANQSVCARASRRDSTER
jgi:hypothetical protein